MSCPCPTDLQEDYKFYGVFDGHCGTRAAKFASRALHLNLELFLNAARGPDETQEVDRTSFIEHAVRSAFRKTQSDFLEQVGQHQHHMQHDMGAAAAEHGVHSERIETVESSTSGRVYVSAEDSEAVAAPREAVSGVPVPAAAGTATAAAEDDSGTTATVALVYPDLTVVAHVGDSRAVMCCDDSGRAVEITEGVCVCVLRESVAFDSTVDPLYRMYNCNIIESRNVPLFKK